MAGTILGGVLRAARGRCASIAGRCAHGGGLAVGLPGRAAPGVLDQPRQSSRGVLLAWEWRDCGGELPNARRPSPGALRRADLAAARSDRKRRMPFSLGNLAGVGCDRWPGGGRSGPTGRSCFLTGAGSWSKAASHCAQHLTANGSISIAALIRACFTVGTSGRVLKDGIEQLGRFLRDNVLEGTAGCGGRSAST